MPAGRPLEPAGNGRQDGWSPPGRPQGAQVTESGLPPDSSAPPSLTQDGANTVPELRKDISVVLDCSRR